MFAMLVEITERAMAHCGSQEALIVGGVPSTCAGDLRGLLRVALRSQGNWRWEGPLGTPLGLVHWKRYNVVLVSGLWQSDSVIHISILFQIFFPFRVL